MAVKIRYCYHSIIILTLLYNKNIISITHRKSELHSYQRYRYFGIEFLIYPVLKEAFIRFI